MGNVNYRIQNNSGMSIIRDVGNTSTGYNVVNNNNNIDPGKRFNKKRSGNSITTNTTMADIISAQLRKKKG